MEGGEDSEQQGPVDPIPNSVGLELEISETRGLVNVMSICKPWKLGLRSGKANLRRGRNTQHHHGRCACRAEIISNDYQVRMFGHLQRA